MKGERQHSLRDGVHVWRVDLHATSRQLSTLVDTLSQEETVRADRYRSPIHRQRFIIAHGALRDILSRYTGHRPHDVPFVTTVAGKPALVDERGEPVVHFSLSHSADCALVAVTAAGPVGVDVEKIDPTIEVATTAERFFATAEVEALLALDQPQQVQRFYHLWTCKEAYLKARGDGILNRLSNVTIRVTQPVAVALISDVVDPCAPDKWRLQLLEAPAGFAAALATPCDTSTLRMHSWRASTCDD